MNRQNAPRAQQAARHGVVGDAVAPQLLDDGVTVVACDHQLQFIYARLSRFREVLRSLDCLGAVGAYLLDGVVDGGRIAREGEAGHLEPRLASHANSTDKRVFSHFGALVGPSLSKPVVQAVEALIARQIPHVGRAVHASRGATMPQLEPAAWRFGATAFVEFRKAALQVGIDYLEPEAPDDVASLPATTAIIDRWTPGYFEARKARMLFGRPADAERHEFTRGDYIVVCERRDRDYWLLRGSEIRAAGVASGRKQDAARRDRLIAAGKAVSVRGYPDRLELLTDVCIGWSLDRATKFLLGSAAGPSWFWRPIEPAEQAAADTPRLQR